MATQEQTEAARRNVKKAQAAAKNDRTISHLSSETRSALGREGAKAAARKRGDTSRTGTGAGAMTVVGCAVKRLGLGSKADPRWVRRS